MAVVADLDRGDGARHLGRQPDDIGADPAVAGPGHLLIPIPVLQGDHGGGHDDAEGEDIAAEAGEDPGHWKSPVDGRCWSSSP